jgi:hypothetical protein
MKVVPVLWLAGMLGIWPTAQSAESGSGITVQLTVPDAAWTIAIDEIYRVANELWVISTLRRTGDLSAQVISTVRDSVEICAYGVVVKHFVVGKTWHWENEEPYVFLHDLDGIEAQLQSGTRIYVRPR